MARSRLPGTESRCHFVHGIGAVSILLWIMALVADSAVFYATGCDYAGIAGDGRWRNIWITVSKNRNAAGTGSGAWLNSRLAHYDDSL